MNRSSSDYAPPANAAAPLVVPGIVKWPDFDPVNLLHPSRTVYYAMDALEVWFRDVIGVSWQDLLDELHLDTPTVHVDCDYMRALAPDLELTLEVRVARLGTRSVTFAVDGRDGDGNQYFRTQVVIVFVTMDARDTAIEVPPDLRKRMAAYQAACGDA